MQKIVNKILANLEFLLPDLSRSVGYGRDRGIEVLARSHLSQDLFFLFEAMLARSIIVAMR